VPSRSCRVSFTDSERLEHAVEVSAASVYEAAVLALAEFRRGGFADAKFGPPTRLAIRVKQPETEPQSALASFRTGLMVAATVRWSRFPGACLRALL